MAVARRALDQFRKPEYTGKNRCIPCTATNLGITAVVAAGLAVLWLPLGVVFALAGAVSIWLRGYLVPGTPELTRRYFPEWLLEMFDKHEQPSKSIDLDAFDPETTLLDADVVEPCSDVDDLCLTEEFERAWREEIAALEDEHVLRVELAEQLDLDPEAVSFESFGDAYVAREQNARVGQWESRSALLADLAAAKKLPDWIDDWEAFGSQPRSELLGGLRIFVEVCPACGGQVTADTEIVESCCRSTTVVAVACDACDDRLLEVPYEGAESTA